jgi:hypothetical protein
MPLLAGEVEVGAAVEVAVAVAVEAKVEIELLLFCAVINSLAVAVSSIGPTRSTTCDIMEE